MPDFHGTAERALSRSGLLLWRILKTLGISRGWYYRYPSFSPQLDGGSSFFAAGDDEWIVIGYKHKHPGMSFREIAYALMDEDLAYLSPATVYRILKKNNLITPWNRITLASTRPDHARSPDERWQTDIMY